jgi:hypothetical protein
MIGRVQYHETARTGGAIVRVALRGRQRIYTPTLPAR